jgi:hypothetical protein
VLVEVLVFDRDGGLAQQRADLRELDRVDAGALGVAFLDLRAVTVLDQDGAGGKVELAGIGQCGRGIGEGTEDEDEKESRDDGGELQPAPLIVLPPLTQVPAATGRRGGAPADAPTLPSPSGGGRRAPTLPSPSGGGKVR